MPDQHFFRFIRNDPTPRVTELGKLHPFVGTQHPNRSSGPAKSRYFRVCIICRLWAKTSSTVCGVHQQKKRSSMVGFRSSRPQRRKGH